MNIFGSQSNMIHAFSSLLEKSIHSGFGIPVFDQVQPALVWEEYPCV
jgi:hypothetical protein